MNDSKNEDKIVIGGRNPFFPPTAVLLGTGKVTDRYTHYLNTKLSEAVATLAMANHPIVPGNPAFSASQGLAWLDTVREKTADKVIFNITPRFNPQRAAQLTQGFQSFLVMNKRTLENVSYLVNPRPMNLDETIPVDKDVSLGPLSVAAVVEPEVKTIEQAGAYNKPAADLVPGDPGYFKVKA